MPGLGPSPKRGVGYTSLQFCSDFAPALACANHSKRIFLPPLGFFKTYFLPILEAIFFFSKIRPWRLFHTYVDICPKKKIISGLLPLPMSPLISRWTEYQNCVFWVHLMILLAMGMTDNRTSCGFAKADTYAVLYEANLKPKSVSVSFCIHRIN